MGAQDKIVASPADTLSADLIRQARRRADATGRPLIAELEEVSGLGPEEFLSRLGRTLRFRTMTGETLQKSEPLFDQLPFTEALNRECVLVRSPEGVATIVVSDPFADDLLAWVDERLHGKGTIHLAHPAELAAYFARFEEDIRAIDTVGPARGGDNAEQDVETLSLATISEDSSIVVKLVNSTLYDALKAHASDIHLEMLPSGMHIKYRVDGVLTAASNVQGGEIAEQVISRIKVMADLDIAEKRVPQDGRFKVAIKGRHIDFRVSIMPSIYGEDAVLRILDKQDLADQVSGVRLDSLGFDEKSIRTLRRLANEPYGMVLVTGPTGSGKTTTLYAMITEINKGQDKIITIEDPVEYQLPGVLQIPVNEKKGLTFARGLRSILRHDPDKIMVGEMRDPETAQIAVQSALTGHLVFTTVHANNVFDVIGRLVQMNVDPYSFTSACNAILAQRLIRMVCPHCAVPYRPDDEVLIESGLKPAEVGAFNFVEGTGCGRCRGTGYKGRTAIAELLILDDEIRQLIVGREPMLRIKERARAKGLRFLRETAVDLVRSGKTTLSEINRVTFVA
jgi:general secretion pathway protein E